MVFKTIRDCRRSVEEQRYIWSMLGIWDRLSGERRETARGLIGEIAASPLESRALFDVLIRGFTPQSVSTRTRVPIRRLYDMRREFYERYRI